MEEIGCATGFLWVKPEGKRPLGKPKLRWEDNIKMDLRKVGLRERIGSIWLRIWKGGRHV